MMIMIWVFHLFTFDLGILDHLWAFSLYLLIYVSYREFTVEDGIVCRSTAEDIQGSLYQSNLLKQSVSHIKAL